MIRNLDLALDGFIGLGIKVQIGQLTAEEGERRAKEHARRCEVSWTEARPVFEKAVRGE